MLARKLRRAPLVGIPTLAMLGLAGDHAETEAPKDEELSRGVEDEALRARQYPIAPLPKGNARGAQKIISPRKPTLAPFKCALLKFSKTPRQPPSSPPSFPSSTRLHFHKRVI